MNKILLIGATGFIGHHVFRRLASLGSEIIGNGHPVGLIDFIHEIEKQTGRTAKLDLLPLQAGDVYRTWADTAKLKRDYGFAPSVPLSDGVKAFVDWYRSFYGV